METHSQKSGIMKEELRRQINSQSMKQITKVWYAFSKFIKNQCEYKMKTVETNLIGAFVYDHAANCKFYPSPEYLEAGNFRPHRDIISEVNG